MIIRHAIETDLEELTRIEAESYPKAEGASRDSIRDRISSFPDCFWILEEEGSIRAFINGMATDESDLTDMMYEDAAMHSDTGKWQMIFSVVTDPKDRGKGYAGRLIEQVVEDSRKRNRSGIVLTCKESLLTFYEQYGFKNEGVSQSTHGNVLWYQMRYLFQNALLQNIEKIHTTELGAVRIKRNLSLDTDDVVEWCRDQINSEHADITRNGKNWYVTIDHCMITVNAYSYTIITAHRVKKREDYTEINKKAIDSWKNKYDLFWMRPITQDEFARAKEGDFYFRLTPVKNAPSSWIDQVKGKKVLGVAAGGGQQIAILAALGAQCTLLELSQEQLSAGFTLLELYEDTNPAGNLAEKNIPTFIATKCKK